MGKKQLKDKKILFVPISMKNHFCRHHKQKIGTSKQLVDKASGNFSSLYATGKN